MTKAQAKAQFREHRKKIQDILTAVEERLAANVDKVTVGDYIRLSEFERDIDSSETPREIKVTWVDKTGRSDTGE